jgi:hypothetical protein
VILPNADNFAVEEGMGTKAVEWMNSFSKKNNNSFNCELEGYTISTFHFGNFEVLSWKGNWSDARKIIVKASGKLNMKVIEAGYHQKDNILLSLIGSSKEHAKVYRKGNFAGILVLGRKSGHWIVKSEKLG